MILTLIRLQVTGIPVVFVSALEGKGRMAVMHQVVDTYEKWCSRLPTARLNRWLRKVHTFSALSLSLSFARLIGRSIFRLCWYFYCRL